MREWKDDDFCEGCGEPHSEPGPLCYWCNHAHDKLWETEKLWVTRKSSPIEFMVILLVASFVVGIILGFVI